MSSLKKRTKLKVAFAIFLTTIFVLLTGCPATVSDPTFLVVFETNGGTAISSQKIKSGDTAQKPEDPEKENCTFGGWYTDEDFQNEYNFDNPVTNKLKLYAKWNEIPAPTSYTVTFETNGGTNVTPVYVTEGVVDTIPAAPEKTHYNFAGWFKDSNLTQAFNFATDIADITENITLYAGWTIIQRTITFNVKGGSAVSAVVFDEGTNATAPAAPEKYGYRFEGWYSDEELTTAYNISSASSNLTEDITLYAKWNPKQYKATFVVNGGSYVSQQTLDYNTAITKPQDPKRTHYTFGGWYTDEGLITAYNFETSVITQDISLYAKWTIITHVITVNTNGGTAVTPITFDEGSSLGTIPSDPKKTGYTFAGWFSNEGLTSGFNFATDVSRLTDNITVYAKWNPKQYKATFVVNGGSYVSQQTLDYNTAITKPQDPKRTHYTFGGWYTDEGLITAYNFETSVITQDISLYAKWTIITHVITVNTNGGTAVTPITFDEGSSLGTIPSDPKKTGYTFAGWFSNEGLTSGFNFATDVSRLTDNITVYAKWNIKSYTVTFDAQSGTPAPNAVSADYGSTITSPQEPEKTGYSFGGWFKDANLTDEFIFGTDVITDNINLKAKWNINVYTVTFNSNGGSDVTTQYVNYNDTAQIPAEPSRTGYSFAGWNYNFSTPVTGNIEITASWTIDSYPVKFMLDGNVYRTFTINYNSTVDSSDVDTPEDDAKIFDDWYIGNTKFVFTTAITGETTITGKWKPVTTEQCVVTYKNHNDVILNQIIVSKNVALTQPTTPIRNGYSFDGWLNGSSLWDFSTAVTDNLILKQKWTPNSLGIEVTLGSLGTEAGVTIVKESATFTATTGFAVYSWELLSNTQSNVVLAQSDQNTFTVNTTSLSAGYYSVYLLVQDSNGNIYQAQSQIRVVKGE